MTEPDPERLLAEALRAHAVRAPLAESSAHPDTEKPADTTDPTETDSTDRASRNDPATRAVIRAPIGQPDPGLELLSGADHERLPGLGTDAIAPASEPLANAPAGTTRLAPRPAPLSVWWIVLLAVLLGLAAG